MKIVGKRYLDENFYKSIVINEDMIKIGSMDIADDKENSDVTDVNVMEVVNHFCDYSKLNLFYSYNGAISAKGENGRTIVIDNKNSSEIKDIILRKYLFERENNLYNTNACEYHISISDKYSSYNTNQYRNSYVLFGLDGVISQCEYDFICKMIDYVFEDELISIHGKTVKNGENSVILKGGNKKIILTVLTPQLIHKIDEHNKICNLDFKKRSEEMELQLKMEGF